MRKELFVSALLCVTTLTTNAQVYPGDRWAQLPVVDPYGDMLNPSTARMMAELDAKRQEHFEYYQRAAQTSINAKDWRGAISYVNEALKTGYYTAYIYYLKGYAYEQQNELINAKRFYRKAKRKGSTEAAQALWRMKNNKNK